MNGCYDGHVRAEAAMIPDGDLCVILNRQLLVAEEVIPIVVCTPYEKITALDKEIFSSFADQLIQNLFPLFVSSPLCDYTSCLSYERVI